MSDQANAAKDVAQELPETIEINGVTYRREADWVDKRVNEINSYEEIARRTGLTFRQAFWLCHRHSGASINDNVMPSD